MAEICFDNCVVPGEIGFTNLHPSFFTFIIFLAEEKTEQKIKIKIRYGSPDRQVQYIPVFQKSLTPERILSFQKTSVSLIIYRHICYFIVEGIGISGKKGSEKCSILRSK